MKILIPILLFTLLACTEQRQNLDYPSNMEDIRKVTLTRPDKASNGKFATIKDLTEEQTKELLKALNDAKPVGPIKFMPDYYIVFSTTDNETRRIKINGNHIKGYDNDYSYEIETLDFLEAF